MLSNRLILCHPFFCLQSFLGGQSNGTSALEIVLSMNIQGWCSLGLVGLVSAFQGTLKNLLQHHNSKASVLQHSAFFMVQLSHLYMTTGKNIPLTVQNFVSKVIYLVFNMLSRLVITFLPRSKRLLNSCLQSPSAVTLEPMKIKSVTASTLSPFYLPWSNGTRCHGISFLNAVFQACFFILLSHPHSEAL